jgi:hypothetical protein
VSVHSLYRLVRKKTVRKLVVNALIVLNFISAGTAITQYKTDHEPNFPGKGIPSRPWNFAEHDDGLDEKRERRFKSKHMTRLWRKTRKYCD